MSEWRGPDYVPEADRAEYTADYVMQYIEALVEQEARGHERSFWMLEHLYEMHKLRDMRFLQDMYSLCSKKGTMGSVIFNKIVRM